MSNKEYDVLVIGGGAAGFFAAIHAAMDGKNKVAILEKSNKLLSKVKISGGGRCNLTHNCPSVSELVKHFPRGGKSLRKGFEQFGTMDTMHWFKDRGVNLKIEEDGRVFPTSDDSQSIIDCLMSEANKTQVHILLKNEVQSLVKADGVFELGLKGGQTLRSKKVIVASGGHPKSTGYDWLRKLSLSIREPIPSLFTFNVPNSPYKDLMGLSVPQALVQIPATKWKQSGALLITHWGFSAPAVIKLSAWAAIDLHLRNYQFPILINWCGLDEESVRSELNDYKSHHPKKLIRSQPLFKLPTRLWERILDCAGLKSDQRYLDVSKKNLNRVIEVLVRQRFEVKGKTTFKEEFVTCGGVDLSEVNLRSFESKTIAGLFFAGEVLNVDGVTGGFNFQHAWTSGYLAGRNAGLIVGK